LVANGEYDMQELVDGLHASSTISEETKKRIQVDSPGKRLAETHYKVDNEKAKEVLGLEEPSLEETVIELAIQLLDMDENSKIVDIAKVEQHQENQNTEFAPNSRSSPFHNSLLHTFIHGLPNSLHHFFRSINIHKSNRPTFTIQHSLTIIHSSPSLQPDAAITNGKIRILSARLPTRIRDISSKMCNVHSVTHGSVQL
jgi:hypothetical protein